MLPVILNGLSPISHIIVNYQPPLRPCYGNIKKLHFNAEHAKLSVHFVSMLLDSELHLGLGLSVISSFLFLQLSHKLLEFLGIKGIKVKQLLLYLDSLHLRNLNVVEQFPLRLCHVSEMEEIVQNYIIEFKTLGLVDCETEHVLKDVGNHFLGYLVPHYEYLVAPELRSSNRTSLL